MKEKILICGNGPGLPGALKGKRLEKFKIVRVNDWIDVCGNGPCDIWAFFPYNQIGEQNEVYDFTPYLKNAREIWMPHWGFGIECKRITGRMPNYLITKEQTENFHNILGWNHPTSGAVVVYMATLLDAIVYIAGFDFYEGEIAYPNGQPIKKIVEIDHKPEKEKAWFETEIKKGRIVKL
uniref:Uncharacterized protein n=1 Tax=viral metagenome TaxID=1070528 RepID=A0A6M3L8H9_9ZZZZ